jgi:glycosyltransferase involved in cell wall biosynthesis
MKLGLIAYAEDTGLGYQTRAYYNHLKPYRTMVLKRTGLTEPRTFRQSWYPDAFSTVMTMPSLPEVDAFLDGLDVVLLAERSPSHYLLRQARKMGVKTIIVPNYEYFDHDAPLADLYAAPTTWRFADLPEPKTYLPFPIDPKFRTLSEKPAKNFLHIAGKPISPDRNGTFVLLEALNYVTADVNVTITCIEPRIFENHPLPTNPHVTLSTHLGMIDDLEPFYDSHDALIMPRRFGGLCLPVNEALAHGLPVIMPDISPNSGWLPKHWLIPAEQTAERKMAGMVDIYSADPKALAAAIDAMATKPIYYLTSCEVARQIATDYSWDALLPMYMDVLASVLS